MLDFTRVLEVGCMSPGRDAADLAPVRIGQVDRQDTLPLRPMFRAFWESSEHPVDVQPIVGEADRRGLRVAILADRRDHARTIKDGQNLIAKSCVHGGVLIGRTLSAHDGFGPAQPP